MGVKLWGVIHEAGAASRTAITCARDFRLSDTTGRAGPASDDVDRQLDRAATLGLLLDAYSGSADVHAVVTAFVLAATRSSVSAGRHRASRVLGDG